MAGFSPEFESELEFELSPDMRHIVRQLHAQGQHRFANAIEWQALARAGVTVPELAHRLGRTPPSWLTRAARAIGLRPEPGPRIY